MSNMNDLQEVRNIAFENVLKSSISESLTKCNTNFNKIANADYLRGATGESMFIQTVDLNRKDVDTTTDLYKSDDAGSPMTYEDIYTEIKTTINPDSNSQQGWDGNFGKSSYDQIHLIYTLREDGKKVIVSSLPFIYHDPRYSKPELLKDEKDEKNVDLVDLYDLSCTIYWQNGGFVKVQNFPTIYYDGVDFKWKIHGVETGLEAQGPKGEKGSDGEMYIVSINKLDEKNKSFPIGPVQELNSEEEVNNINDLGSYHVRSIMHLINEKIYSGEDPTWEEVDRTGDYGYLNGKQAFVYYTETDDENNSCSYSFSATIKVTGGNQPYVQFNKASAAPAGQFIMSLAACLNSIQNTENSALVHGLFIPSTKDSNENTQYHILYEDGGNLHIGKFDSYSKKLIGSESEDNNVIVDKNLEVNGNTTLKGTEISTLNVTDTATLKEATIEELNVTDTATLKEATIEELNVTDTTILKNATIEELNVINGNILGTTTLEETEISTLNVTDTTTLEGTININTPQIKIEENGNIYLGKDSAGNNPCNYTGIENETRITLQSLIRNQSLEEIKYSDLVDKRDERGLIPGKLYRIVDYITMTYQGFTDSAKHQFDIIVLALSKNKLSERAWAIQHEFDDPESDEDEAKYFKGSKLEAWQLWYCLDNDNKRFTWADNSGTGKGVIYRMIDEFGNDCPYDFKNIRFYIPSSTTYIYTFTGGYDISNKPEFIPSNIDGDSYDWSLSGEVKQNQILTNSNILQTVFLRSYVGQSDSPYSYCRGNKLMNCSFIYLDQSYENTIYDKHGNSYSDLLTFAGYHNYFIFNGDILANNVYQSNQ